MIMFWIFLTKTKQITDQIDYLGHYKQNENCTHLKRKLHL